MGYWCTLHFFDDKKFYNDVIPEFKGEKGNLAPAYLDFLKVHITGGISRLSSSKINTLIKNLEKNTIKISNSFDKEFKRHHNYHKIDDYQRQIAYLGKLEGYYDFCKFFEYYLFKKCADFFPHIPLGKGGVSRNFLLDINSLSCSIISELDNWNPFFCDDLMGIGNWLTNEDVELLYLDKENLCFESNARAAAFLKFLEIAYKNKLGFIAGVGMREDNLEQLPKNKLLSPKFWKNIDTTGMLFKR